MSAKRAFFGIFQKIMVFCCAIFFGFANAFSANLPSGYTELEYIESTGTQYIDLGYTLNTATDDIELIFQAIEKTDGNSLFGARINTSRDVYTFAISSGLKYRVGWGNSTPTLDIDADTNKHTLQIEHNGGIFKIDGTTIATQGNVSITTPTTATLFAIHATSGSYYYFGALKIFGYKKWTNGVLEQNLVPCRRNSDNVLGMYDLVSDNFLTNGGTGEFTAGPEVLNPCRNLFDISAVTEGYYIAVDGTVTPSTSEGIVSDYIPVNSSTEYILSCLVAASHNTIRIHNYDSSKTWISQASYGTAGGIGTTYTDTFTTASNAKYVRISISKQQTNIQLERGSTATAYVPFCANLIKIATTAYNTAQFSPVVNDLNTTIATIRDVVTKTINQTAAIASLQADKQTRPEDACPAGKKCLLVETEENGVIVPHWFPIIEAPEE